MVSPFLTTPSALSKEASQHFPDAQPPLLYEEGTIGLPHCTRSNGTSAADNLSFGALI